MMRKLLLCSLVTFTLTTLVVAQQPNGVFSALNVNGPASVAVVAPANVPVFTDSVITVNVKGFPGGNSLFPGAAPAVVLFATSFAPSGSIAVNSFNGFGFQLDLPDQGAPGYSDQEFVNGFTRPGTLSFLDAVGNLSIPATVPACTVFAGTPVCITQTTFNVSAQALVVTATGSPFGITSTGAATASFTNGYRAFSLNSDNFAT
ncbi:MAG: hypothetical protein KDB53_09270, partial [Planctomycetes bacterium]|nr:hypothetical protein [Planctomycetota bacterium]